VEIAPGATITCAEGATLFVAGTLRARAAAAHARITCSRWAGLVVSAKGHVDLEGVELENGSIGLGMAAGAADSTFSEGAIVGSLKPLTLAPGTKLTLSKSKLSTPVKVAAEAVSISEIEGSLVASRIDYDANGNEGISVKQGGELDLQDSTLHGKNAQDLVSAYGAKHLKIAYSTFLGAHCGLHVQPSESFEIDHVTSDSNIFGITIYGSGSGPNTVKASNFTGTAAWLDFQGDNGAISFDGVYTSGSEVMTGGPPPSVSNKAMSPISDAKPR
ncbi:MAG TPA: right-handed parallel beta-helix repeat-containing protein, partial [Labilithrix sp.]|nr:right-handed parallel beta-helix repeat-containing protein [Labilithrix sp.]